MPPLVIFGGTKGVGLELARLEARAGRHLIALARSEAAAADLRGLNAQIICGDALTRQDVGAVFDRVARDCDVVSTLGGLASDGRRADDEGNTNVIDEARSKRVLRFVLVTSIGCGEMAPYRSARAIAAFGAAVDAKTRAEQHLRATDLAWTIVRPGGLRSEPATGRGILSGDAQMHGFIHRADVADLVFRLLRDDASVGRVFAAVDSAFATSVNPIATMK
jgi:uncharacterized protein YbjT (DUF2867 family)